MRGLTNRIIATAFIGLAVTSNAFAQSGKPTVVTEQYGSWKLECRTAARPIPVPKPRPEEGLDVAPSKGSSDKSDNDEDKKFTPSCSIVQIFSNKRTNNEIARLAFAYGDKEKKQLFLDMRSFVYVSFDIKPAILFDKQEIEGAFKRCLTNFCFASFDLKKDSIEKFQNSKEALLRYPLGNGKAALIKVDPIGLVDALAALKARADNPTESDLQERIMAKSTKTPEKASKSKKADETPNSEEQTSAPADSGLPMFYANVVPLNASNHSDLKLQPAKDAAFAKSANSIVLAASELPQAAMHYPVVFSKFGDSVSAFAVTGYNSDENVYVDENGKWRADTYIPAYVRRYPFILVEDSANNTLSLAADVESDLIGTGDDGVAIYADGKPTEVAQTAMNFCLSFHREMEKSAAIFKQIEDSGILIDRSAEVTLADGKQARIAGFMVVDENKLAELPDEKFLELRKSGALNLIYCQLWSMRVWNNLLSQVELYKLRF